MTGISPKSQKCKKILKNMPKNRPKKAKIGQNRPKSAKNEKLNKYTQNDRNFSKNPKMSKFYEKCAKNRPKSAKIGQNQPKMKN